MISRGCFSKLTTGAGKDITFLKSMGRHHLPLSGPWCPYCNKGISFKISDSFLRWNAKPSHWARWWASYFCKAKFQCLYSPKAVPGCFMSCYFESQKYWLSKLLLAQRREIAVWPTGSRLHQLCCLLQKVCPRHGMLLDLKEGDGNLMAPLSCHGLCCRDFLRPNTAVSLS